MKSFVLTDLQRLFHDAYTGISTNYSKNDLQDAVRNAIKDVCGGEWNYYKFMDNRYKVFAIIAQNFPIAMNASLAGKFGTFASFKDTAMGDLNYFDVEDDTVYPVYTSSRGNGDVERQKIINKNFSVPTQMKIIKLYDELDRFMAGKCDLAQMTDKATSAFEHYVGQLISDTIYNSYTSVGTNFKALGAFSASTLDDIIEHVKAATGAERLQIWGTTTALANVADGAGYSDKAKDGFNSIGYYDTFRGTDLFALPQAFTPGTQTFAVNRSYIIILPASEPIVKVVFEGDALVNMTDGMGRNDLQPEILYGRRVGAAALTTVEGKFGIYKFQ
jgi:hypothetical protein